MKRYLEKLGYLVILLAPLDTFKFWDGYFSVYRLALILLFLGVIVDMAWARGLRTYRKSIFLWIVIFQAINVITYMISTQKKLGLPFFLNDTLGVSLILAFVHVYDSSDIDSSLLFFVRSQYVTLVFSVYTIYLHFISGRNLPTSFSFLGFSMEMSDNQIALLESFRSFLPRLFLPYATTLHLDYSVGIAAIICLYFKDKYKNKKIWYTGLALVFSMITLLSAQKGPIIALFICIVYYAKMKGLTYIFAILVTMLIGISYTGDIFSYTIRRFVEFGSRMLLGEDRHILLVYEALRIWFSGLRLFFIGVGYSSVAMKNGYYTYIPNTFLCTYATLLGERGILGAVSILFYARFWRHLRLSNEMLMNVFVFVMLSFLFYELRYVQTSWIIVAIFSFGRINRYSLRTIEGELV